MPKYCVPKPEPKWAKVEYEDSCGAEFAAESCVYDGVRHIVLSTLGGASVSVPYCDMQAVIDSLQAFYDQEKGEG